MLRTLSSCRGAVLFLAAALAAGCGSLAPQYPGHPQEPRALTPVEHGGIALALPPGWRVSPESVTKPGYDVKAVFDKTTRPSPNLSVSCMNPLVARENAGNVLRSSLGKSFVNLKSVRGPFSLGAGMSDAVIQGFTGSVSSQGRELPMYAFIAYNMEALLKCSYGMLLVGQGTEADLARIEPEFVAMVRSLKR